MNIAATDVDEMEIVVEIRHCIKVCFDHLKFDAAAHINKG